MNVYTRVSKVTAFFRITILISVLCFIYSPKSSFTFFDVLRQIGASSIDIVTQEVFHSTPNLDLSDSGKEGILHEISGKQDSIN